MVLLVLRFLDERLPSSSNRTGSLRVRSRLPLVASM
jgi:hypothetical protein